MILAAHQLHYLPWLRYFHKMALCDTFVVLDNIQFNKNGWQNRNKVKTATGWAYVTVPVRQKFAQPLAGAEIDNKQPWQRKHWGRLQDSYGRTGYFEEYSDFFKTVYDRDWDLLNDLNYEIVFYLMKVLGIKARVIRSSDMNLRGEATERLIGICKELGAKAYLTGSYAADVYLDKSLFEREGIELLFQAFECPPYPQVFPEAGFIPELSIVDLLFSCGPKSMEILMQNSSMKTAGELP